MSLRLEVSSRLFHFKQPAGTSRGVYLTRRSWFVTATDDALPGKVGVGECAPLPQLSCDDLPDYAHVLEALCRLVERKGGVDYALMRPYPSMLFGIETALMMLHAENGVIFDTPFSKGEMGIPINGLVWMGRHDEMLRRMEEKVEQGFSCVKLKIGAIGLDEELDLMRRLRKRFSPQVMELRLDANGAFQPDEALKILASLETFQVHSIEQPIRRGQWREMAGLCRRSPIPIALDEELIGVNIAGMKCQLLDEIKPAYIILKPSLHGGMHGAREWIGMAEQRNIGSWVTSALESNVGLNAIAQFAAHVYGCPTPMPQGLGTGLLFTDNVESPISIEADKLVYHPKHHAT